MNREDKIIEYMEQYTTKESAHDPDQPNKHHVSLVVGVRTFQLRFEAESADQADWTRRQLATALADIKPL